MKQKNVLSLMLAVVFMLSSAAVFAGPYHGGGRHFGGGFHGYRSQPRFGFYLGFPMYRPYYSYPYYPVYPPTVITVPPPTPPVYIERSPPPVSQQLPSGYWYYCNNPEGYYPYVRECPYGWRQVDPIPPQ